MLSFSTEFPIDQSRTATDFSEIVRVWLIGSRYTNFSADDLKDLGMYGEWSANLERENIESLRSQTQTSDSVAIKYKKIDDDLEWLTVIVFSSQEDSNQQDAQWTSNWVSIRITCESLHPAARLPPAKKPVLIRILLEKLGGGQDGLIKVSNSPMILTESDLDFAAFCISGNTDTYLPIVYVSAQFGGGHLVDTHKLANELAGMAHVIVEPDRLFSINLMDKVRSENVYGGTIGIYWPDGGGRRSFFIGRELGSVEDIRLAIFDEIRSALNNRRPFPRCTWASVMESHSSQIINQLQGMGSTEIAKYIAAFDEETKARITAQQEAEKEIERLKSDIRMYEAQIPMNSGLSIASGQERNFYQGELLNIAYEAFVDALTRVQPDSRRKHVLESFIKANQPNNEASLLREQLKSLLRDYRNMDARIRKTLEEMGFNISEDGKHEKLVYHGDDRYTFTLPKSGSDYRGGLNAAHDISRLLF